MARLKKPLLIAVAVLLAILVFVAFALPGIIVSKAAEAVNTKYSRNLAIRTLTINPFTGKVEARGIRLSEKGSDAVFFACSSVSTRISPASIYHRAPVVSSVDIVSPYVHIVRMNATTYNFSDFIPKTVKKEDEKPARFSLNNIWLKQGSIDFTDRLLSREQQHTVRKLEVRIPFVSNLPYLADSYITPGMSAMTNGSPFLLEGKIKPFAKHVEVIIDVRLRDLDLPHYAAYLPANVPIRLMSGGLTTDLQIIHRAVATGQPELMVTGTADLAALELQDRQGSPLLALEKGSVKIKQARVLAGSYDIDAVELTGPELTLNRDRKGVLNVTRLSAAPPQQEQKPARPLQEKLKESVKEGMKAKKTEKVVVNVAKMSLAEGQVHFRDEQPPGGFKLDLDGITLTVDSFTNQPDKNATYSLAFASNRKEQFDLSGTFSVAPVATTSKAAFKGLVLEALYPYLANVITAPVAGRLDGSADLSFTADTGPQVTNGALKLKNLGVRFGEKDGVKIPEIAVTGSAVDLKGRTATVADVSVKGGSVAVSRLKGGKLSPLALLKSTDTPATSTPPAIATKSAAPAPFRYAVKGFSIKGTDVTFNDYEKEPAASFDLARLSVSLKNITGPGAATIPYTIATGYADGSITSKGTLGTEPVRLNGTCTLKGIPITDFEDYFPPDLHIIIADGLLDTDLKLNLTLAKDGPSGTFAGNVDLRQFHSLDDVTEEDLLTWKSLHLDGIHGDLKPFSLKLAQVALTDFFARVTIEKDSTLNLQKIYGKPALVTPAASAPATTPAPAPASATANVSPPAETPKKVAIDAVTMQGGTLIFTDRNIRPEFKATMFQLGGKISGLSSEITSLADVDLRGNLRNQSPLSITGKINPLRGDLYVDMKVSFADIELSPLTPYTGTYLGYSVEKGKLFLDLLYKIDKKQLSSENRVFIDQFTFGDKVESDKATKLPVRLAVALLKNANGEIHLDLPVTGRTDDPKFSVWKVIGQVLMNLLEKAATAPFKLLGSLFGGSENFSSIAFIPGSAQIAESEQQKLGKLGSALVSRPALKLEVTGYVDKERDPEGYRQVLLQRKMQAEKYQALVKAKKILPGQTAESLKIEPEEYSKWLAAVYKKEKFPKPRNMIGMAKDLPDPEMKKLIFANTTVENKELTALARERLVAVKEYLITSGKVPRDRLFEKTGDIYEPPEEKGTPASRVEFGLAVK